MPTFHTTVLQARVNATGLEVPPEIVDELGSGRKPAVVVTVGDYTYRSTVAVMGGRFLIPLSSEHRSASGLAAGDEIDVTLTLDDAPREIAVPSDLLSLLAAEPVLQSAFERLSYSRKRALVEPVDQAKTPETRQRRIDKVLDALRS
ncbi:YdeI/OmpD-associated family protein [Frondihabitans peucedani]|uniref:DUF1905 domain-containing protein n=1 Tax=Frondihabitans peucedani TaxID=598626 RepID=A0ABP8E2V6_9MICO